MSELIRFPTRRRVLENLGLASGDRRAVIDAEIRRIDATITGLGRVKRALLVEYRAEIRRRIDEAI